MLLRLPTLALLLTIATAHGQQGFGPLDPMPPTIPIPQILAHMAQQESAFAAARDHYTFRQDVTFETLDPETNRPDGAYHQISDITFDDAGRRVEHVLVGTHRPAEAANVGAIGSGGAARLRRRYRR